MQVEVWSDYACPWCALGLARFEVARRAFAHGSEVTVVHRSYELDPGAWSGRDAAARRGTPSMEDAVARRYGMPVERVRALNEYLTGLAAEAGMVFAFDRVQLGSTFDAHRLTQASRGSSWEGALVRALFEARFALGRQLADHDVLRTVASEAGMPENLVGSTLDSDDFAAEVLADEAAAAAREITGVPHFLIGGAWGIPGAQDVQTLTLTLEHAWSRLPH